MTTTDMIRVALTAIKDTDEVYDGWVASTDACSLCRKRSWPMNDRTWGNWLTRLESKGYIERTSVNLGRHGRVSAVKLTEEGQRIERIDIDPSVWSLMAAFRDRVGSQ